MESPHSSRPSYRHETLWRAEEIYRQHLPKSAHLKREVFAEVPPRVEYTLTDRGRSLEPVIDAMRVWGEAHMAELIIEEEATYKQN